MTDTARVPNVYYDMNVYNPTSIPIEASIDNKLLYPLLNTSDNYSVAITKAKIPLDGVPLTKSNIGLKLYQLGLKIGTTEELAYVRQVNANQDNFVWNCPQGSQLIKKYKYTSSGVLTQVGEQDISIYVSNVYNFVVDDYSNLFVVGSDSLSEVPDKLFVIDEDNNLILTSNYTHIKHIYIDRGQNLYICDESPTPTVHIYSMQNEISLVNLTEKTTLTTNHAGDPLVNLLFCVADGEIIVGYNQNTVTLYNEQYQPQTDIQEQAITQLQNVANIDSTANTYILANSDSFDDTLYGVQNQTVYRVNDNTQYTLLGIKSPYVIVKPSNGYSFGIGENDNFTYATTYPVSNPPGTFYNVNNSSTIKDGCIWSLQTSGQLYSLSPNNIYYAWNYSTPPNVGAPNTWVECGEFELTQNPTPTPINADIQATTNKVFVVGSDNNLYVSQNPIAQIELVFNNLQEDYNYNSLTWGLRYWDDTTGIQQNSLVNNFTVWSNPESMFKEGNRYFVSQPNGTGTSDLTIYDIVDYSVLSSNPNFDSNMLAMTYLPTITLFAYQNNNQDIVFRDVSTLAIVHTIPSVGFLVGSICALGNNHIAVCEYAIDNFPNIYIYSLQSLAMSYTYTMPYNICDITSSMVDIHNGAYTLFALAQTQQNNDQLGNQIYKLTFSDNTYSNVDTSGVLYTTARSIAQINIHQNIGDLLFIEGDSNTYFQNVQTKSLMQTGGYSDANIITASMSLGFQINGWIPNKSTVYMQQSTAATHRWSQVTSNIQVKSVTVSRTNPNRLYAIGLADSKIYMGSYLNDSVTFEQFQQFAQLYDYISTTPNSNPAIQSTLYLYGLQSQNLITSLVLQDECGDIARNEVANQYLISKKSLNQIEAFNAETLQSVFTTTLTGAYRIFSKNGSDIDAGKVDIYDMAVFINAINLAFVEATTKINQALGSGTITSPPVLTLDYLTGLCTLTYPQTFTQSANGILFNKNLLNLVYYQSTPDTQSGLYQLLLNTQQESITQQTKSIYNFNQLDKILFVSNCIFVVGAFFGKNESNNVITDIDVVTGDFVENIGQTLFFQPNFLRTYVLQSNLALERIQMIIKFQYRDGTDYQLYINNGQNCTVKMQFVKKF